MSTQVILRRVKGVKVTEIITIHVQIHIFAPINSTSSFQKHSYPYNLFKEDKINVLNDDVGVLEKSESKAFAVCQDY